MDEEIVNISASLLVINTCACVRKATISVQMVTHASGLVWNVSANTESVEEVECVSVSLDGRERDVMKLIATCKMNALVMVTV